MFVVLNCIKLQSLIHKEVMKHSLIWILPLYVWSLWFEPLFSLIVCSSRIQSGSWSVCYHLGKLKTTKYLHNKPIVSSDFFFILKDKSKRFPSAKLDSENFIDRNFIMKIIFRNKSNLGKLLYTTLLVL